MARKRQSKTPVAESDNTTLTATIELPTEMPVEPITAGPQAAEPQQEMPAEQTPTFVERYAARDNRPLIPDPFLHALDKVAGVRLFENKQARVMAIKFDEKPSQPVIDLVKDAGYSWRPADRVWTHSVRGDTALSSRIDAERLYHDVCQMIRQDKGIDAGQDIPF